MADDRPLDTLPAVRPTREVRVVESDNPVMSTAAFEHMIRVANIMADSGMMPKSLIMEGKKGAEIYLDHRVILARAFMIVEQAAAWRRSPFALMQHASFVHGKLCWEGKVVNAILSDDYGIDLDYQFGTWIAAEERCDLSKGEGQGDLLAVRVSGLVNGKTQYVDGSVGTWKTVGEGSPWRPGAMHRQCRYRGQREWARAYRSGAMLGVVTTDEIEDAGDFVAPATRGRPKSDLRAKLTGPSPTEAPAISRAREELEPHDPETGEVIERPTETASVQNADAGPASSASATNASGASAAASSSPSKADAPMTGGSSAAEDDFPGDRDPLQTLHGRSDTNVQEGCAGPGEVYFHTSDNAVDPKGKRATFKDGAPFSRVPADKAESGEIMVYDEHAPAQAAQGAAVVAFPGDRKAAETKAEAPASGEPPLDPKVFDAFAAAVGRATSWLSIKPHIKTLRSQAGYASSPKDARKTAMLCAYNRAVELNDPVRPAEDIVFYELWALQAPPSEIKPVFGKLIGTAGYQKASEFDQERLAELTAALCK